MQLSQLFAPSSLAQSCLNSEACTIYAGLSSTGGANLQTCHTAHSTSDFKTILRTRKKPGSRKRWVRWSSTTLQGHVQILVCITGLISTQCHQSPSSVHSHHSTSTWRRGKLFHGEISQPNLDETGKCCNIDKTSMCLPLHT